MISKVEYALSFALIFLAGAFFGIMTSASYVPRLKAYGCDGASGVLYADEEDDLPLCEDIRGNR